jgi:predicted PurR-regulated permease PerM
MSKMTDDIPKRPSQLQILAIAVALLLIWAVSDVLLLIFLAALLAIVLRSGAAWVARRIRLPFRLALAAVVIFLMTVCIGLGYWIGPDLARQAQHLAARLAPQIMALRTNLAHSKLGSPLAKQISGGGGSGVGLLGPATTAVGFTFRTIADLVVLIVTTLYFATAPEPYIRGIVLLAPPSYRTRAREILETAARTLRLWVLCQFLDMLIVGALAALGLSLLGVPEPYALGVLAGMLTFIPYFGVILACIPAVMVALTISWSTALWTVLVYSFCHLVEGYVVSPLLQRRLVELPPAVSVISMSIMGVLFGPLGLILGTPIAATRLVLIS